MTSLESLGLPDSTHQLSCAAPVLACLAALASEPQQLQQQLLACASNLSQCPLAQLYLLDKTHTGLHLSSQWFDGAPVQVDTGDQPTNWFDQQLLQYCLSQNRSLNLRALDNSLYATPFLPETVQPWRSLLCLPLHGANQQLAGLLLLARHQGDIAEALSEPLSHLGSIGLGRLSLLQQQRDLQHGHDDSTALPSTQAEYGSFGLIGQSPAMQQVYRLISKVLHNPVTVLIGGETGTGKELVARAIHDYGFRRSQAFIAQNCSALPEQLLESELFGYRKGAFTGAMQDRAGLFDAADGGTLFLDEIGDMPLALQAKLLRVLQEGEIRPLGSTRSHRVDVRIIAATHQRLHEQVQRGLFREDLYYRLGHFPIELPPLRERGSDIRQLALHFASDTCTFLQRSPCHWSDSALAYLASHRFPGNVRELKGLIARALLLCDGNLLLPEHLQLPGTPEHAHRLGLREQLEVVERNLLIEGLQLHGGNQTLTAQALGLPRRTLLYRMQRLGVTADTPKQYCDAPAKQARWGLVSPERTMSLARLSLLTTLAMLAFAGNSVLCRLALRDTAIDPASFTSLRLISGAAVLWLLLRSRSQRGEAGGSWGSAIALFVYAAAFSWAYIQLDAASGALLLFAAVQVSMLGIGLLRGERLSAAQTAGFALALVGLAALLAPGASAPPVLPAISMLSAGVAWGLYSLRGRGAADPLAATAGNFTRAVPLTLILSLITLPWLMVDLGGALYALASGALTSGLGYAIWYAALPGLRASAAASVQLSVPVITAVGGLLLLNETPSMLLVLSSLAILGGIALVIAGPKAR